MAGWLAEVHYPDGLVQYGCWQTSTDSMWSGLFDEVPLAQEPTPRLWHVCVCDADPEPVRVYCAIDDGHWAGTACRGCHCLRSGMGRQGLEFNAPNDQPDFQKGRPVHARVRLRAPGEQR